MMFFLRCATDINLTEGIMIQRRTFLKGSLAALGALAAPAGAQTTNTIEAELSLITPVSKFIHDAALAEFEKYAKERWKISVKTSALAAGTPVAYGRIVEWKGRPDADIFWGGESALFDKLAEQKLLPRARGQKPAREPRPPEARHRLDPREHWQAQADSAQGPQWILDRHRPGALWT